jgi:hypothetical protein
MFGFGKKKQGKEKKGGLVPTTTENTLKRLATGKIKISVYRTIGGNTPVKVGDFFAQEKRDEYNNLVAVNEDELFNEDIDFSVDDVYRNLTALLNLDNLTKEDKILTLKKKIKEQEVKLKILDKFPRLNAVFNYCDEQLKKDENELLLQHVSQIDTQGSFYTIENGVRVFSYHSVEGLFIPVWHGLATHTQYPDHTRKKKINIQEEYTFLKEIKAFNEKQFLANVLTFASIIVIVLLCIGGFGAYKGWQYSHATQDKVNEQTLQCSAQTVACYDNMNKILNIAIIKDILEKRIAEQNFTIPSNATSQDKTDIAIKVLTP